MASKTDPLIGLKENVVIGKLIPAGTGAIKNRDIIVSDPGSKEKLINDENLEKQEN